MKANNFSDSLALVLVWGRRYQYLKKITNNLGDWNPRFFGHIIKNRSAFHETLKKH